MTDKETVIVESGERQAEPRSNGWIGVVIAIVLILLFFALGGFNMFSGGAATGGGAETPAPAAPTTGQ